MPSTDTGSSGSTADWATERRTAGSARTPAHERLGVREDEPQPAQSSRQLGVHARCPRLGVGVVGGLAVGHVEDSAATARVEALDGRLVEVARHRVVDRVVGGRRGDLPAFRVEEPLAVGVVVDLELEADPVEQALERLGLGLGGRRRAAVGLARRCSVRSPRCRSPSGWGSCGWGRRRRRRSTSPLPLLSRRFFRHSRSLSKVYW